MKAKIFLVLFVLVFVGALALAVDYSKDPDGSVKESKTVSAQRLNERLAEIEEALKYNNNRVAAIGEQVTRYEAVVVKFRESISSHEAEIANLEAEKTKIEDVLK